MGICYLIALDVALLMSIHVAEKGLKDDLNHDKYSPMMVNRGRKNDKFLKVKFGEANSKLATALKYVFRPAWLEASSTSDIAWLISLYDSKFFVAEVVSGC